VFIVGDDGGEHPVAHLEGMVAGWTWRLVMERRLTTVAAARSGRLDGGRCVAAVIPDAEH
jgi:hypothetical protein